MIFRKQFTLTSSHFSSADAYSDLYKAIDVRHHQPVDFMLEMLEQVCGRVFTVNVECEGFTFIDGADDTFVDNLVNQWNNTNLSVHRDFLHSRYTVTVDRMAYLLAAKIGNAAKHLLSAKVTVTERTTSATATWHGESRAVS